MRRDGREGRENGTVADKAQYFCRRGAIRQQRAFSLAYYGEKKAHGCTWSSLKC